MIDQMVSELRTAAVGENAQRDVVSILQANIDAPAHLISRFTDELENDVILFEDDTVSIWYCRFMPGTTIPAHDHQMTATIGVFDGVECNRFWKRNPGGAMIAAGEKNIQTGQVVQFNGDAIHDVICAGEKPSQAIHVYLGKITTVERSRFDLETGKETAYQL